MNDKASDSDATVIELDPHRADRETNRTTEQGDTDTPRVVDVQTAQTLLNATVYCRGMAKSVERLRAALRAGRPAETRSVAVQLRHAVTEIIAATTSAADTEMFERGQRAERARAAGDEQEWEIATWHAEIAMLMERFAP